MRARALGVGVVWKPCSTDGQCQVQGVAAGIGCWFREEEGDFTGIGVQGTRGWPPWQRTQHRQRQGSGKLGKMTQCHCVQEGSRCQGWQDSGSLQLMASGWGQGSAPGRGPAGSLARCQEISTKGADAKDGEEPAGNQERGWTTPSLASGALGPVTRWGGQEAHWREVQTGPRPRAWKHLCWCPQGSCLPERVPRPPEGGNPGITMLLGLPVPLSPSCPLPSIPPPCSPGVRACPGQPGRAGLEAQS